MASRTLAWPPEKTENREASVGAKTPTSQGWRSQGQARKPRQHWGNGMQEATTEAQDAVRARHERTRGAPSVGDELVLMERTVDELKRQLEALRKRVGKGP